MTGARHSAKGKQTGPFLFCHIPKTGGTSLINTVRGFTPYGQSYTGPENRLSPTFAAALAEAELPPAAFIHGHPDWGACRPFLGRARFLTLLREPRLQVISHFLHALRDPSMPQHAAARALGFGGFLRTYPHFIVFQTQCLYRAITDPAAERARAFADPAYGDALGREGYFARQLGPVFAFLEEMALVGTLEEADRLLAALAQLAGWSHVPPLPHDNAVAEFEQPLAHRLAAECHALEAEAVLAPFFAIERATYAKARALARCDAARAIARAMAADGPGGGPSPYAVHASALGEIWLGENFLPERAAGSWWEPIAERPAAWWTGDRQLARLYIRRPKQAPCRLLLHATRLHGLQPAEIAVCLGNAWLPVSHKQCPDGSVLFSVPLPGGPRICPLALYPEWNCYPAEPPFYPALRITAFSLAPAAEDNHAGLRGLPA